MTWVMAWNAGMSRHDTEDEALAAAENAKEAGALIAVVWEDIDPVPHRAVWNDPGCWWPSYRDFDSETEAHAFAAEKSREINDEVGVHKLPATTPTGGTR